MYTEYFGLREEPFTITPNPRFLYFSRKHQEAFSTLLYGVQYRKGFIEITGEIGAGKTTLCRRLLTEISGKAHTALILNPGLSDVQLLNAIVDDFGIKPKAKNKKGYFDALNRFLFEVAEKGKTSVLIIDEAQNLGIKTLEQIRLLSNLETEREKLLQIILVGQPELRESLRDPSLEQLRQRIALRYHVPALDCEETAEYIRHRLRVAGGEGVVTFSAGAAAFIYSVTSGIPRMINNLCDKAMMAAYVQETHVIDERIVETAFQEAEGGVPVPS